MDEADNTPCSEKIAFDTRKQAEAAATVAEYRYGGPRPHVYRCLHCGLWHLSSS